MPTNQKRLPTLLFHREREIVQRTVAQLSWWQDLALIEKLADSRDRLWYAAKTLEYGANRPASRI